MTPESALAAIGRVVLAAIGAPRRMGTGRVGRRGWNRGVRLGVTLATPAEHTMMLSAVGSRADGRWVPPLWKVWSVWPKPSQNCLLNVLSLWRRRLGRTRRRSPRLRRLSMDHRDIKSWSILSQHPQCWMTPTQFWFTSEPSPPSTSRPLWLSLYL
jgi:hypothetical protein